MFIAFIKFIHLMCALNAVGLVGYSVTERNPFLAKYMDISIFLAAITGCLLVYPKGYTFHTAWIRAALLLVGITLLILAAIYYFQRKKILIFFQKVLYSILLVILVVIIHDAVQKTTELPLTWLGLGS